MGSPAKKFNVGEYKNKPIADAPTAYLLWWVNQTDNHNGARCRLHVRAGCIVELRSRGIQVTAERSKNHGTWRALKLVERDDARLERKAASPGEDGGRGK